MDSGLSIALQFLPAFLYNYAAVKHNALGRYTYHNDIYYFPISSKRRISTFLISFFAHQTAPMKATTQPIRFILE